MTLPPDATSRHATGAHQAPTRPSWKSRELWMGSHSRPRKIRIAKRVAVICGLISIVLAVLTPFLPVHQKAVTVDWPQAQSEKSGTLNVAAPLIAYTPAELDITIPCQVFTSLPAQGGSVFGTLPSQAGDTTAQGLFVSADAQKVYVTGRGSTWGSANRSDIAASRCTLIIHTGLHGTIVHFDGLSDTQQQKTDTTDPAARPQVTGFYTDLKPGTNLYGMHVHMQVDSRFQLTRTWIKTAAIVIGILCALASVIALSVIDRQDGRRLHPRIPLQWRRIKLIDVFVVGMLLVWGVLGVNTSDDGYFITWARIEPHAGYLVNYFRWLGVPEDPFSWWPYTLVKWATGSEAVWWLRLPEVLTGIVGWLVLSREVIPRLGLLVRHAPAALWSAAGVYLAFWMAYNNGLRPEPFVAVGALLTWSAVERHIATGRFVPLAIAILFAEFTVGLAPGGAMAVVALLAGGRQIIKRLVRRYRRDGLLPLGIPIIAVGIGFLFIGFAHQTYGSVQAMSKVHADYGPTLSWWQEGIRYYYLLLNTVGDASLDRRTPVLMSLLCMFVVIVIMLRRGHAIGAARGPIWRGVAVYFGTVVVMTITPTKWTHHFGVFAAIAAAMAAMAAALVLPRILRSPRNRSFFIASAFLVMAVAFSGPNGDWFIGAWGRPWWNVAPAIGGIQIAKVFLALGVIALLVGMYFHLRADYRPDRTPGMASRLFSAPIAVLSIFCVLFGLSSTLIADYRQRDSFSWLNSNIDWAKGEKCSLADDILVEKDPNTGMLRPATIGGKTPSIAAALTGTKSVGFAPNTIPDKLQTSESSAEFNAGAPSSSIADSLKSSKSGGSNTANQTPTTNTANSADANENGDDGTTSGSTGRTINGSNVELPYGLNPRTTPVVGSYGYSGTATLTSDWYSLPRVTADTPLITVAAAGSLGGLDMAGRPLASGQRVQLQAGRIDGNKVTTLATLNPFNIGPAPQWTNLRFPTAKLPAGTNTVRLVAEDNSPLPQDWIALTPPRMTTLITLQQAIPHNDPVMVDWLLAFAFPCQTPMYPINSQLIIPKWRILPEHSSVGANSNSYMGGLSGGGLLGIINNLTTPTTMPTYLRNNWGRDWGAVQRLKPQVPMTQATVTSTEVTRFGWWNPGPMRSLKY